MVTILGNGFSAPDHYLDISGPRLLDRQNSGILQAGFVPVKVIRG
jgi:hypothetical protein